MPITIEDNFQPKVKAEAERYNAAEAALAKLDPKDPNHARQVAELMIKKEEAIRLFNVYGGPHATVPRPESED